MHRWLLSLGLSGLLLGVAISTLIAGREARVLVVVSLCCAGGAYVAYRHATTRMVRSIHGGIDDERPPTHADTTTADAGGATERTTSGDYDDWGWASADEDDPFWSEDVTDWEDPWATTTTDPADAGGESERTSDWWQRTGDRDRESESGHERAAGDREDEDPTRRAYAILGVEPGADDEAVRAAYRARVKETHPDRPGGDVDAFLRVREAYAHLQQRAGESEELSV